MQKKGPNHSKNTEERKTNLSATEKKTPIQWKPAAPYHMTPLDVLVLSRLTNVTVNSGSMMLCSASGDTQEQVCFGSMRVGGLVVLWSCLVPF